MYYRAISVLLGEAWKSLPPDEREQYSQRAKIMADEQKKLFPDCWKRKGTLKKQQQGSSNTPPSQFVNPNSPFLKNNAFQFGTEWQE